MLEQQVQSCLQQQAQPTLAWRFTALGKELNSYCVGPKFAVF